MVYFVTKAIKCIRLDDKCKAVGVFLDLQKAFDYLGLDHKFLFDRLYSLGVQDYHWNGLSLF